MNNYVFTTEEIKKIDFKYRSNLLKKIIKTIPAQLSIINNYPLNIMTLKKPISLNYINFDLGECLLYDDRINYILEIFIETLEEYSNIINLNSLYKNLKGLEITTDEEEIMNKFKHKAKYIKPGGLYSQTENKVYLHPDAKELAFTHELLHLAVAQEHKNIIYNGFSQINNSTTLVKGIGINEGTTEYINNLLFNNKDIGAYSSLVFIVKGIVNLIGEKKFIELYFENDLQGLIEEIDKYSSIKVGNSIILALDRIHNLLYTDESYLKNNPAKKTLDNLKELIASINLKKQYEFLKNNLISQEEYNENIFNNVYAYLDNKKIERIKDKYIIQQMSKDSYYKSTNYVLSEKSYNNIIKEYLDNKILNMKSGYIDYLIVNEQENEIEMEKEYYAR